MLNDDQISIIHDYQLGADCFPGIRIAGGVCYFLRQKDYHGNCEIYSHKGDKVAKMKRPLLEKGVDTFIRINEAVPVLRKVQKLNEMPFSTIVSARKPFGLPTDFFDLPSKYNLPEVSATPVPDGISIVGTYKYKTTIRYVDKNYPIPAGKEKLDKYKVFVSRVLDNGFDWTKERLKPFLGKPNIICTETFLCVGEYDDEQTARNVISYINTKFFHLLMFLKKVSQDVSAKVYALVPLQDFSKPWTDEELYEKYKLNKKEIAFIESMIKPMDASANIVKNGGM